MTCPVCGAPDGRHYRSCAHAPVTPWADLADSFPEPPPPTQTVSDWRGEYGLAGTVTMTGAAFAALRHERDEARRALTAYGGHRPGCVCYSTGGDVGCTCGWADVLRLLPRVGE